MSVESPEDPISSSTEGVYRLSSIIDHRVEPESDLTDMEWRST